MRFAVAQVALLEDQNSSLKDHIKDLAFKAEIYREMFNRLQVTQVPL